MNFEQFSLDWRIDAAIKSVGYTTPTPIQQQAIPVVVMAENSIRSTTVPNSPILWYTPNPQTIDRKDNDAFLASTAAFHVPGDHTATS